MGIQRKNQQKLLESKNTETEMKNPLLGDCTWLKEEFLTLRMSQWKPSKLKNKQNKLKKTKKEGENKRYKGYGTTKKAITDT